ncbi:MAG: UTRA domain-containing protein [Symbiopectobacterium sp.]
MSKTRVRCRAEIAEHLQRSAGCDVYLLKRARDIDDDPGSIEENYVPLHLITDVEKIDISLYTYFRSHGIVPIRTHNCVSAQWLS